eukprot:110969-Pelagomonas_calceolata.AAC.4
MEANGEAAIKGLWCTAIIQYPMVSNTDDCKQWKQMVERPLRDCAKQPNLSRTDDSSVDYR